MGVRLHPAVAAPAWPGSACLGAAKVYSRFGADRDGLPYLQKEADRWFEETDGEISYLGDWHLHHAANPVLGRIGRAIER